MADKVTPGVGRFSFGQPTAANNPYLKIIQDAGNQMEGAGLGVAQVKAEVNRREAKARTLVPDADFTNDAYSGVYGANAQLIQDRIDGKADDSYDFSNANDVARFDKDVEKLKNDIAAAEPAYGTTIGKYQDLTTQNQLYLETGEIDPLDIEGLGEVEDANIREGNYQKVMLGMEIIRDNKPVYKDGKYVYMVGDEVAEDGFGRKLEFDSPLDVATYLETNIQPNYQSAKPLSPEGAFGKENYAVTYPNEKDALEGFTDLVKGDLNSMAARYAAYGVENVSARNLMEKQKPGEDGLTDYQRKYRDALMEEWRQRTNDPTPVDTSSTKESVSKIPSFKTKPDGTHYIDGGLTAEYITPGAGAKIEFQLMPLEKPVKIQASNYFDEGKVEVHALGPHPSGAEFMDVRIKTKKDVTRYKVVTDQGERTFDTREAAEEAAGDLPITETSVEEIVTEDLVFDPLARNLSGKEKDILNAIKGNEAYMNWFTLAQERAVVDATSRQ